MSHVAGRQNKRWQTWWSDSLKHLQTWLQFLLADTLVTLQQQRHQLLPAIHGQRRPWLPSLSPRAMTSSPSCSAGGHEGDRELPNLRNPWDQGWSGDDRNRGASQAWPGEFPHAILLGYISMFLSLTHGSINFLYTSVILLLSTSYGRPSSLIFVTMFWNSGPIKRTQWKWLKDDGFIAAGLVSQVAGQLHDRCKLLFFVNRIFLA